MSSLFEGTPQAAPSSATSTTQTPQWYQDLTYQQMMAAKAVAGLPYQQYAMPRVAEMTPDQLAAAQAVRQNVGMWQPSYETAMGGMNTLTGQNQMVGQGADYMTRAAGMSPLNALGQYMPQALQQTGAATARATDDISGYMSPYTQNVTDEIARLGARNLNERLLPAVSDQFIRAGQFGSSRMGEFGARALRDTQESVLGQQAQALQQGYGQALQASQADLNRRLQAGQQYGQFGQLAGQLTGQEMMNLANIGQATGALGSAEAIRQQSVLQQLADLGRTQQGLYTQDAAALQALGQEQQSQQQKVLDSAYQSWLEQQQYPQRQLDWYQAQLRGAGQYLPQTATQNSVTTQFAPSPLSQLASGYFALRGLTSGG